MGGQTWLGYLNRSLKIDGSEMKNHLPESSSSRSPDIRSVCIFCGASMGRLDDYRQAASAVGTLLARRNLKLVYGGGNVGLMGVVANACLDAGGTVTGVIPKALVGREVDGDPVEHTGISQLEIVDSMHTRKARMAALSDAFIALPGGFGTLEELFEVLTWSQLGFHSKPVGLLNVAGYFQPLLDLCDRAVTEGFLRPDSRSLLLSHADPVALLDQIGNFVAPGLPGWIHSEDEL